MAKAETLTYDFATYDTGRFWRSNAKNVAFVDGELRLRATAAYHYIGSFGDYDLEDSHFAIEFVGNSNAGNGSISTEFRAIDNVEGSGGDYFMFSIEGGPSGDVYCIENVGEDNDTEYIGAYDATDYRYLRLRESSGIIYWETSANGYSWTVRKSKASALSLYESDMLLVCGRWSGEPDPGYSYFDNLNLMPSPPPSANSTAFFAFV